MSLATYEVCGIPVAGLTPQRAADVIVDHAERGEPLEVHLCNAYTLSLVDTDSRLRDALRRAHLNLPDGTPVSWFGRRTGIKGPVRGPGLVGNVATTGAARGIRHYFYGGNDGVAQEMADRLSAHAPGLKVAGAETPPFRELDDEELDSVADNIASSGADVVWVGIGTPRQDYLVPRLAARLHMPVVPVGAAFDFWAGRVKEAPSFVQGTGLEWIYRLLSEPRRLWRRYLFGNPRFLLSALRHRSKATQEATL